MNTTSRVTVRLDSEDRIREKEDRSKEKKI